MLGVYFSGTGNSKYCLKVFLENIDESAAMYSIEDGNVLQQLQQHQEIIVSYPVQYSSIPKILKDFIMNNHEVWNNKRVYIIATMGLFSGDGSGVLARLLKCYGSHIQGGLHIKMPDSIADEKALKRTVEENRQLVFEAHKKIEVAAISYKKGKPTQEGLGFIAQCLGLFGQRLYFGHKTKSYSNKLRIDQNKCIQCKKCSILCPTNNIAVKKGIVTSSKQLHC